MSSWQYLVKFEAQEDGKAYYAQCSQEVPKVGTSNESFATVDKLNSQSGAVKKTIRKLLPPADPHNAIICIGLNYLNHAKEANLTVPKNPPMWYKPAQSLHGEGDVPIGKVAQENFLDFEGEFTIITSKDAKDVSVDDAQDYILGYTIGNDLTARMFQAPTSSGGQYSYAKAFDKFAPLASIVVNPSHFGSVKDKQLKTAVNGKVVQDSPVDLIWGAEQLVSFLCQGRTLPAGTAIMTGTPSGIGYFQTPKSDLKNGDVVEISIEKIGTLKTTVRFE